MTDQNKKEQSALEQLKALQEKETISSLQIKEPDLKGFDASSVFEIDTTQKEEPKHKIFGKRSQRHAQVKVKASVFDNEDVEVQDNFCGRSLEVTAIKAFTEKTGATGSQTGRAKTNRRRSKGGTDSC